MRSSHTAPLRIGLLTDTGDRYPTDSDRLAAVEDAARSLEADGHTILPLTWAEFDPSVTASSRAFADIVAVNLAEFLDGLGVDISATEPLTQAFVERGRTTSATALWASLNAGVHVSHALWTLFDRIDCILMPMLAKAPLPIGSFPSDHRDTNLQIERMAGFAPLAALANISGFPALTLPFGHDADGLPLPVQLMAPFGNEPLLLSLAARLEAEDRWQHKFTVAGLSSSGMAA